MDKFIVSARKYRPQTFDSVIGQEHITTTLKNAIKNQQLAHAFLFCGPRGVGKTTCARILAKTINCENRTEQQEACNSCDSCLSFQKGTSFNIHELDAASNNSVDDIRELVEQVRYLPQTGVYKVYIIDEVHMLSQSAFNAFLKTLEEPPSYAIFILATTEKHKILPTILSRCQIFDFKRITINDTVTHLESITEKENINSDKAALQVIAQKSEGCLRDALSLMDKIVSFTDGNLKYSETLEHLNILDEDYYFKLLEDILQQNLAGILLTFNEINRKGFEGDVFLSGFEEFFRNLLVALDKKSLELLDVLDIFKPRYTAMAGKVSAGFIISALNLLNEAENNYRQAKNKRLHTELALIKLTYLNQAVELATGPDGTLSKKKPVESAKPVSFRQISKIHLPSTSTEEKERKTEKASPVAKGTLTIEKDKQSSPREKIIENAPAEIKLPTPEAEKKPSASKATVPSKGKLDLKAIRKQAEITVLQNEDPLPLEPTVLEEIWKGLTGALREEKNTAHNAFAVAKLKIEGHDQLKITANSAFNRALIENEKNRINEIIRLKFKNRGIQLHIDFEEQEVADTNEQKPLNKRQQFNMMAEKYPLVRELKDRLFLDLD